MSGLRLHHLLAISIVVLNFSCQQKEKAPNPWGVQNPEATASDSSVIQLNDIISNGEMIMVTMYGPDTYYEYHGRGMGLHYLLCEKFCQSIGVSLRVDICKDTLDMIKRVEMGEADIIAMPFNKSVDKLLSCAEKGSGNKWQWLVNKSNTSLANALDNWLTEDVIKKVTKEQSLWLSSSSVIRHVYSPILNRSKGVISDYDHLFKAYSSVAQWDWRLLAAQCYQESTFDPRAHSWAGAGGLMQIMPSTADHLGLDRSAIYDPEQNIAAATKYISQLTRSFADVNNPTERIKFVLASYNGGSHHVRDAMSLAKKYNASPYRWSDVRRFILGLSQAEFYNDPVVKHGYMRGTETADYVDRIWARWFDYRGIKSYIGVSPSISVPSSVLGVPKPHPSAKRKAKYNI